MNGGNFDALDRKDEVKKFHSTPVEVSGVNFYDFLLDNYKMSLIKLSLLRLILRVYDKEVLKTLAPLIKRNKPSLNG
jgi:hypothetical protein